MYLALAGGSFTAPAATPHARTMHWLLSEFGYAGAPGYADRLDAFWSGHGFAATTVMSEWRAPSRKALERVIRMEFGEHAAAVMNRIDGASLRYGYRIYHRGA